MNKINTLQVIICVFVIAILSFHDLSGQKVSKEITMSSMVLANKYFMEKWPDAGKVIVTDRPRPSNIWTREFIMKGSWLFINLSLIPLTLIMLLDGVSFTNGDYAAG